MGRRSLDEKNVRKLLKNSGGTTVVSLPIDFIRELKWRDGQKVRIKKAGKTLVIEDWE